jgi:transcriptional antiterminator NusG
MADEPNVHLDDAVSNRSDDTALDEGDPNESSVSRDRSWVRSEPAADEGPQADVENPIAGQTRDQADIAAAMETGADAEEGAQAQEASETSEAADGDDRADVEAEGAEGMVSLPAAGVPTPPAVEMKPKGPIYEEPALEEEIHMDWYILKVQSNRERSIAEALERKMRIEGLDRYFDQVIVPTEKVTEFKGGKKKVVERKLYPGYIVVHMHINDDTWFAVRETSGVGDFTGAGGKPTPMLPHEVARIIQTEEEETAETPKLDIRFSSGDKVKVKEGNFENFEGEVNTIDEASGRVTVMINIFGRSTPVELEYWQIEAV